MRLNMAKAGPEALAAMRHVQNYVNESGLEKPLLELVKIRASQINGCAFCIAMHVHDAVAAGETHQRIHMLDAWQETPVYSEREQAALAWTEAVTILGTDKVPDAVYEQVRKSFSEKEIVDLTMAVVVINGWNRLMIAFRAPPKLD